MNLINQLIKLMENCWDDDQNNRPNFAQITSFLKKLIQDLILTQLNDYGYKINYFINIL